jgi:(p)ppGpp synthase/HD superfamily hydrolase
MDLRIQITDIPQLSHVLNRISRLPHIMSARRLQ